jgi:hypothetical protein
MGLRSRVWFKYFIIAHSATQVKCMAEGEKTSKAGDPISRVLTTCSQRCLRGFRSIHRTSCDWLYYRVACSSRDGAESRPGPLHSLTSLYLLSLPPFKLVPHPDLSFLQVVEPSLSHKKTVLCIMPPPAANAEVAHQAPPKSQPKWLSKGSKVAQSVVGLAFTITFGVWGIKSYNAANFANVLSQKESCRQHPVSKLPTDR